MKESIMENFGKLKRQINLLREERMRIEGAMSQLLKQMKEQFGCSSVEEARELLVQMEERRRDLEERFQAEYESFMSEWGGELQRLERS